MNQLTGQVHEPEDPMFVLLKRFQEDKHPKKVSLGAGTYRDEIGDPWVLPAIRQATNRVMSVQCSHEYLGLLGLPPFLSHARDLALGPVDDPKRVASIQTLGGTGAVHFGVHYLEAHWKSCTAFMSSPTWDNHHGIFQTLGWKTGTYPYYDTATRGVDFTGMVEAITAAPQGSVFVLHACGHNPTGCDLSHEQWKRLVDVFKSREHFAFFDSAYQGLVSGSVEEDRWPVELFARHKVPMMVAQSFSKVAGLYGQRLGALHVLCKNDPEARQAEDMLKMQARREYSTPVRFPAELVAEICDDTHLRRQWLQNIQTMAARILSMRETLHRRLLSLETPGSWHHIVRQKGMFLYSGLSAAQCTALTEEYHIYVPLTGRMSICGLTEANMDYVAGAIDEVVRRK